MINNIMLGRLIYASAGNGFKIVNAFKIVLKFFWKISALNWKPYYKQCGLSFTTDARASWVKEVISAITFESFSILLSEDESKYNKGRWPAGVGNCTENRLLSAANRMHPSIETEHTHFIRHVFRPTSFSLCPRAQTPREKDEMPSASLIVILRRRWNN